MTSIKKNNNWCCEITNRTFELFQKEYYKDTCERGCVFFYWKQIGIDKDFCEKCQEIYRKEETRLEEDSKAEIEELEKNKKNRNCDNCKKLINWKKDDDYVDCKEYKDENWDRGIFGLSTCKSHGIVFCLTCEKENNFERSEQRVFCSKKCMDELENKEEIRYWIQKLTIENLNQEIWRREKLHKRIFTSCVDCHEETNQWDEEEIENATCPDCSADLIEQNKRWMEENKKKKIKCCKCSEIKFLGYRKSYSKIYCVDCADGYREWRKKHFWFCADDCPQ